LNEVEDLIQKFENLDLEMNQANNQGFLRNTQKTVNDPPLFSGIKREFDGFLTRAEIAMESNPHGINNDIAKGKSQIHNFLFNWRTFRLGFVFETQQ
jgi:hypothetical protein